MTTVPRLGSAVLPVPVTLRASHVQLSKLTDRRHLRGWYNSSLLSDFKIIAANGSLTIQVHRVILAAAIPYFNILFSTAVGTPRTEYICESRLIIERVIRQLYGYEPVALNCKEIFAYMTELDMWLVEDCEINNYIYKNLRALIKHNWFMCWDRLPKHFRSPIAEEIYKNEDIWKSVPPEHPICEMYTVEQIISKWKDYPAKVLQLAADTNMLNTDIVDDYISQHATDLELKSSLLSTQYIPAATLTNHLRAIFTPDLKSTGLAKNFITYNINIADSNITWTQYTYIGEIENESYLVKSHINITIGENHNKVMIFEHGKYDCLNIDNIIKVLYDNVEQPKMFANIMYNIILAGTHPPHSHIYIVH